LLAQQQGENALREGVAKQGTLPMLYSVAIAVCLSTTPQVKCREPTAVAWIVAPESQSSVSGCMMHGLLYAASSRLVTAGSYAKVFCRAEAHAGGDLPI
jgi:hypothetical protein